MIYIITLNPALDYYMNFSNQKIKKWQKTNDLKLMPGGKGINASYLLNNLSTNNISIILTGGQTGSILLNKLRKDKINFINFDIKNEIRINIKAQFEDTYELLANSKNLNKNIEEELLSYLNQNLSKNDFIMIMGSQMNGLSENIVENISNIAKKKNVEIVYDFSNKKILELLKFKPFIIKPNVQELENYFDVKINSYEDIEKYALNLIKMGAKNVIVSNDSKGAYFFNKKLKIFAHPLNIKLINASGAGDSMIAGFIYKYLKTNSFEKAINFANASGSGTASVKQIAKVEIINKLFKKTKHEKIERRQKLTN